MPLCLYEIRMSPQLHYLVYGFYPSFFGMSVRFGGYRPTVFLQHGLAVGMWMTSASLVGVWLWYSRASRRSSSGTSWVDLYEQQVAESRRTNALLERIAAALEKPSPG